MLKFISSFLVTLIFIDPIAAQVRYGDGPPPKTFLEADFGVAASAENINSPSLYSGYANPINTYAGNLSYNSGKSNSYKIQGGYYFGRHRNFGIGTGLIYSRQSGSLGLDSFNVDYKAVDFNGNVYRQQINADGPINENIKTSNVSVPIFLRYKKDLTNDMFLTADLGVSYNLLFQNNYSASGAFDYEAVYKIEGTGTNLTYLYDNAVVPGSTDWLVTKAEFNKDNPNGNIQAYFNQLHELGYNVGLGDTIKKNGKVNYTNKTAGFNFQVALNYKIRDKIYGKAGLYVMEQTISNPANNNTTLLTDKPGEYNSLLNLTRNVQTWNYGIQFGIGFNIGN